MKKTLTVAALTGLCATAAHAQSSVTLYGLIDASLTYTSNQRVAAGSTTGHSNWQATDGSVNKSRWGLRGAEDLGGGLKAIFTLENGFNVFNGNLGQNGREFGRQAFVGLAGEQLGAVTLGRQYDSMVDYLGPLALTGTQYGGTEFAHPFDNDNLNNSFRVNNSVKYQSPNFAGLKFGALYGFSNQAGGFSNNRAYSFGASYNYGPLNFAAAYLQLNNSVTGPAITNTGGAVAGDGPFVANRQRTWGAGLNYIFGPATAGFVFTQTRLNQTFAITSTGFTTPIALTGGDFRFNNYEVNGRYLLTPALSLAGAYTYTDAKYQGVSPKWHQFNLQAAYALSKRTDVYVQGVYQKVNGAGGLGVGAGINGLAQSATDKQVAVSAGVRHRF
jgi:GBP family porin